MLIEKCERLATVPVVQLPVLPNRWIGYWIPALVTDRYRRAPLFLSHHGRCDESQPNKISFSVRKQFVLPNYSRTRRAASLELRERADYAHGSKLGRHSALLRAVGPVAGEWDVVVADPRSLDSGLIGTYSVTAPGRCSVHCRRQSRRQGGSLARRPLRGPDRG